jgi:hypothetical protein
LGDVERQFLVGLQERDAALLAGFVAAHNKPGEAALMGEGHGLILDSVAFAKYELSVLMKIPGVDAGNRTYQLLFSPV